MINYILEDFDYENQCWVIVAMAKDENVLSSDEVQVLIGEGYDSQNTTRIRRVFVSE